MAKLKVHVLLKGLQLKLILRQGEGDYKKREGEECNETNVCKHDEDVKDPGAGASDVLVTTNNRPLITKSRQI